MGLVPQGTVPLAPSAIRRRGRLQCITSITITITVTLSRLDFILSHCACVRGATTRRVAFEKARSPRARFFSGGALVPVSFRQPLSSREHTRESPSPAGRAFKTVRPHRRRRRRHRPASSLPSSPTGAHRNRGTGFCFCFIFF